MGNKEFGDMKFMTGGEFGKSSAWEIRSLRDKGFGDMKFKRDREFRR